MDKALADLIRISNTTGKDPKLTQASGGNTSVKTSDGKYMFIKASGTPLKDMNKKQGWRRLRLDKVLRIMKDNRLAKLPTAKREAEITNRLLPACDDDIKTAARPSVEANLHAMLDKCVIHLHPIVIGAYVNAKNGRAEIKSLFKGKKCPPLWIPYAPPGFLLAIKTSRLVANYQKRYGKKPEVIMLAKHGLFVIARTANDAMRLMHKVINRCKSNIPKPKPFRVIPPSAGNVRSVKSAIRKAIRNSTGKNLPVTYIFNKTIACFMRRPDAKKLLAMGPLEPAEMVYVNGVPMWVETLSPEKIAADMKKLLRQGNKPVSAFLVKDVGLFIAAGKKNAPVVKDFATGTLTVRNWASYFGGVVPLTAREQKFIKRWYLAAPAGPKHPAGRKHSP